MLDIAGGWVLAIVSLATIAAWVGFSHRNDETGRLARLEAKIDLLLRNAGIEYDPVRDLPPEVRESVQRGAKIEAIKHYRAATGTGLREAKEVIEEAQRRIRSGS